MLFVSKQCVRVVKTQDFGNEGQAKTQTGAVQEEHAGDCLQPASWLFIALAATSVRNLHPSHDRNKTICSYGKLTPGKIRQILGWLRRIPPFIGTCAEKYTVPGRIREMKHQHRCTELALKLSCSSHSTWCYMFIIHCKNGDLLILLKHNIFQLMGTCFFFFLKLG